MNGWGAIAALAASPEEVYVRGPLIVTPISAAQAGVATYSSFEEDETDGDPKRDAGSTVLAHVSKAYLTEMLNSAVRWRKPAKTTADERNEWEAARRKRRGELVAEGGRDDEVSKLDAELAKGPPKKKWIPCLPPEEVVGTVIGRPRHYGLPEILAVVNSPIILPSGEVVQTEGYHERHRLLMDFGGEAFPDVPAEPTREDAERAVETLMSPFREYQFSDAPSRGVALSGLLTALVRPTLPTAPLHAVSASTPGAGKTQLAQCWSIVATGAGASMIHQAERQEEFRKRLETILLTGDRTLLIDNCDRAVGGAALDAMLTETEMRVRILGQSEQPKVPTNVFMSSTGNHWQAYGDTVRRALVCSIEPPSADPEDVHFDFSPKVEAKRRRPEMVAAALTLMRAHVIAGRPGPDWALSYGSFEAWSRVVRAPIVWLLGEDHDPKRTTDKQKQGDPVANARAALLVAIKDAVGVDVVFTAAEVRAKGSGEIPSGGRHWEDLYYHLQEASGREGWVPQAVGGVLTRNSGRLTDGMRLEVGERCRQGTTYVLREPGPAAQ